MEQTASPRREYHLPVIIFSKNAGWVMTIVAAVLDVLVGLTGTVLSKLPHFHRPPVSSAQK